MMMDLFVLLEILQKILHKTRYPNVGKKERKEYVQKKGNEQTLVSNRVKKPDTPQPHLNF